MTKTADSPEEIKRLLADIRDVHDQASMCAAARGEGRYFIAGPVQCPARCVIAGGEPLAMNRIWFGPATGWLCVGCMSPAPIGYVPTEVAAL